MTPRALSPLPEAEALAAGLPALLAEAEEIAQTVLAGEHGRKRAGHGEAFWQYRAAQAGDSARLIDWRRSARGDQTYVQEKEWHIAQSVLIWADPAQSMRYATAGAATKAHVARVLALALANLLARGGERTGLIGTPATRGRAHLPKLAENLLIETPEDYGIAPDLTAAQVPDRTRLAYLSDFMGDLAPLEASLAEASARGMRGVLLQILDASEIAFPFSGRRIFESLGGTLSFESLQARDLAPLYAERLAARQAELERLAEAAGWQFALHRTDLPAAEGLLTLWTALSRKIGA